jgi:hypothetical protein
MTTESKTHPAPLTQLRSALDAGVDTLYRYSAFDAGRLALLLKGKIRLSAPEHFNDPWDCAVHFRTPAKDDHERRKAFIDWSLGWVKGADKEAGLRALLNEPGGIEFVLSDLSAGRSRSIRSAFRMCCLTARPDSILMWAHYARSGTGMCVGFNVVDSIFANAHQVQYASEHPTFEIVDGQADGIGPLFLKAAAWSYEQEYRLAYPPHPVSYPSMPPVDAEDYVTFSPDAFVKVIVGPMVSSHDLYLAKELIQSANPRLSLQRVWPVAGQYAYEIIPVE